MAEQTQIANRDEEQKPKTIKGHLTSTLFQGEMQKVLPKHVTAERMTRVALTAITKNPKLAECDQATFFRSMLDLSQLGLEPDGRHAHLIPFNNRKKGIVECQLIIDYKGLAELAFRSGKVKRLHADIIREGDQFEYDMGELIRHVPHFIRRDAGKPEKAGEMIGVYCTVTLDGGITKTELMSLDDVNLIRARSKSKNDGPWVTDFNEMAKKTVFKRVSKWIPMSPEIRDAVRVDDDPILDAVSRPSNQAATIEGSFNSRTEETLNMLRNNSVSKRPVELDENESLVPGDSSQPVDYVNLIEQSSDEEGLMAVAAALREDKSVKGKDRDFLFEMIDKKVANLPQ